MGERAWGEGSVATGRHSWESTDVALFRESVHNIDCELRRRLKSSLSQAQSVNRGGSLVFHSPDSDIQAADEEGGCSAA